MNAAMQVTILLGLVLFGLGLTGILVRRNGLSVILGFQLMGVGSVVALAAFAHHHADRAGEVVALIVLAAGVAQALVALSLLCLRDRRGGDVDMEQRLPEFEG
jgi:NADH:ubiquinone oxidoreductase subunit K